MPIPIKPVLNILKPVAKQAGEIVASIMIEEGLRRITDKLGKKKIKKK